MSEIGVFDSGVGGLTVVAALAEHLPGETFLYLGDTARLPYGTKSARTVARYTERNVDFLVARGVKAVVVACNSASALALDELDFAVPTWGVVEPGARRAAEVTQGRVGVIATRATVGSGAYRRRLAAIDPAIEVFEQACPLFVPLVEEGWERDAVARTVAERYLAPLLAERIDTLVLGCTHYPLLAEVLLDIVGDEVRLVDSGAAVAEVVARELPVREPPASPRRLPRLLVTDESPALLDLARRILGAGVELERVDLVS